LAGLTLAFLGPPRVERDGAPLEVDTRKAIALLAYLAVTRQAHRRDALATLLWPEYDQSHARASLRRTLSVLKRGLADQWLEVGREIIGLKRGADLWVDLDQFNERIAEVRTHGHATSEVCSACADPLRAAVELYRGDFLAGFTLRESEPFDEWQLFQTEALRRDLAEALERLVEALGARGAFEQSIAYARRWLALDPLHEPAHRKLMLLYAWMGERAAALRQYRECVRVLHEELGVPPLAETAQLAEAIKEHRAPAPPAQPTGVVLVPGERVPAAPRPAGEGRAIHRAPYPLVGRAQEWATLVQAYEGSAAAGHLVVLEGEAGIGKTRLAEEFLAHARAAGADVLVARCYEGEASLAYAPFIGGLRAALGQPEAATRLAQVPAHWLGEASRLLPELAELCPGVSPAPPLDSPGAQSRFFEGVRQVLLALAVGGAPARGLLFLDDVHWADEASLDLLAYLVRRLRERPLWIMVSWRSEHLPPSHRVHRMLADARRAGEATALVLARLSPADVAELMRSISASRAPVPAGLDTDLYRETEGLPFFLVEYLDARGFGPGSGAAKTGAGTVAAGTPPGARQAPLPGGVRELLRSRLATLSDTGRQLLTTAAVLGRSFDFETVRAASGRGDEEAVAALEELVRRGLVREMAAASGSALTFDFSHERLRELVYEETSLVRRRVLHRRVAEALRGRARGGRAGLRHRAAVIAHHYQLAGQEAEAAEHFKLAGEHARALYANAEALAHFRSALALGHPAAAELHEAIGDLELLSGEYAAAQASYEVAAALGGPGDLARVEHKLGNLYGRRGDWELAESHFEAALAALGEEGRAGDRARLAADWSLVAHRRGQPARAQELAARGLELAEAADTQALAQTHNILGMLASRRGELDLARHHLGQSLALSEGLRDPSARVAALNNLALVCGAGGELGGGLQLLESALRLCVAQGDRHREAALHNNLADLLHLAGRPEEAMAHLKQAVTIFAEIGAEAGALQPEIWKLTEW
jgi:DNA-binding SARP family transcriptional activator/predicted ATPase